MKNKNGFTLVEVTISIALLAVLIVFVLGFISILRNNEDDLKVDITLDINKSLIEQKINKDIMDNGGIKSCNCSSFKCNIVLNNNQERILTLSYNSLTLTYYDALTDNVIFSKETSVEYPYNLSFENGSKAYTISVGIVGHSFYTANIVSAK